MTPVWSSEGAEMSTWRHQSKQGSPAETVQPADEGARATGDVNTPAARSRGLSNYNNATSDRLIQRTIGEI